MRPAGDRVGGWVCSRVVVGWRAAGCKLRNGGTTSGQAWGRQQLGPTPPARALRSERPAPRRLAMGAASTACRQARHERSRLGRESSRRRPAQVPLCSKVHHSRAASSFAATSSAPAESGCRCSRTPPARARRSWRPPWWPVAESTGRRSTDSVGHARRQLRVAAACVQAWPPTHPTRCSPGTLWPLQWWENCFRPCAAGGPGGPVRLSAAPALRGRGKGGC